MNTEKKHRRLGYSKSLVLFIVFWVVEVIIFAESYLWKFTSTGLVTDVSPLYVLITSVVAAGISAIISVISKSRAENTAGGIVFESAMAEINQQSEGIPDDPDTMVG